VPEDGAHRLPACIKSAGKEDKDQCNNANRLGELRIIKVNSAGAFRACEHPNPDEQQEGGDTEVVRRLCNGDAQKDQGRPDEKEIFDADHFQCSAKIVPSASQNTLNIFLVSEDNKNVASFDGRFRRGDAENAFDGPGTETKGPLSFLRPLDSN